MSKTLHRRLLDIARAQDDVTHSNEKGRAYERECQQAIRVRDARISALEHDITALQTAGLKVARLMTVTSAAREGEWWCGHCGCKSDAPGTITHEEYCPIGKLRAALAALDGKEEDDGEVAT